MHMQAIAGVLQESIREEFKQTIRDEIPGIVIPIVNGVVHGLKVGKPRDILIKFATYRSRQKCI